MGRPAQQSLTEAQQRQVDCQMTPQDSAEVTLSTTETRQDLDRMQPLPPQLCKQISALPLLEQCADSQMTRSLSSEEPLHQPGHLDLTDQRLLALVATTNGTKPLGLLALPADLDLDSDLTAPTNAPMKASSASLDGRMVAACGEPHAAPPPPGAACLTRCSPCNADDDEDRWSALPDDILKGVMAKLSPAYLRKLRLVCSAWAEFVGRATVHLKPEQLDGPRLRLRFPFLRTLDLCHCHNEVVFHKDNELALRSSVNDDSLAQLASLTSLHELSLRGCGNIVGPGLAHLRGLTGLRVLNLRGCGALTNKGLEHVARLPGLRGLNLRDCCQITNDGLRRLEAMQRLRNIALGRCNGITDKGLSSLARMPSLEAISISSCPYVTDKGFKELLPHPRLTHLTVVKCPGVTEDGLCEIAKLKAGVCRPLGGSGRGGPAPTGRRASGGLSYLHGVFGLGELEMLLADMQQ